MLANAFPHCCISRNASSDGLFGPVYCPREIAQMSFIKFLSICLANEELQFLTQVSNTISVKYIVVWLLSFNRLLIARIVCSDPSL